MLVGNELLYEFSNLSKHAQKRAWIVSPFIGSWNNLKDIMGENFFLKNIDIKLLTDKNNSTGIDGKTLQMFINCGEVRSLDMLHAKIYIFDDKALITSANLSETAFCRRYEIGHIVDFNEDIENIFNDWWNISNSIEVNTFNERNYTYKPECEDNTYHKNAKKLWSFPAGTTIKNNTGIEISYNVAKEVYYKKISRTEGKNKIAKLANANENSAADNITTFLAMIEGKKYTRTLNEEGTRYYFENILIDFGLQGLRNALDATKQHAKYYASLGKSPLRYAERLIDEFEQKYFADKY